VLVFHLDTGLEPTNFYKVVVHPSNPNLIYAGAADIKGIVSEDGGQSWRLLDPFKQAARNSIYAFAFDPDLPRRVFIATAKWHDFPHDWYASPLNVSLFWREKQQQEAAQCCFWLQQTCKSKTRSAVAGGCTPATA
jgi:hypothetical protein